ncbi:DNA-binding WRKY [Cynara cardunculus var. scolymus]|uniref:DNA-binding WRKY n=1 Tax=Cynara cardunculus var. scolymus TaxID=59895 RepID=A0A118K671_CYNCS|nr:DNA-binding WRKY [Cynara cardunculus var. scolymus]
MDGEWDLHAVVRSCSTAAVKATTVDDYDDGRSYNLESLASGNDGNPFVYPTFGENARNISGGLEDVYNAGCGRRQPLPPTTSAAAIDIDGEGFVHEQMPMLTDSHSFSMHAMNSQSTRTRKRCSTTKACGAKKQVERNPMDPAIFIVSYSGEHIHPRPTHRSSLAGSTRSNKFNTDNNKPPAVILEHPPCSSSSPASGSSFSPTTSFKEDEGEINDEDEYNEDILINPNIVMNEEVLKRFRNLNGGGGGSF